MWFRSTATGPLLPPAVGAPPPSLPACLQLEPSELAAMLLMTKLSSSLADGGDGGPQRGSTADVGGENVDPLAGRQSTTTDAHPLLGATPDRFTAGRASVMMMPARAAGMMMMMVPFGRGAMDDAERIAAESRGGAARLLASPSDLAAWARTSGSNNSDASSLPLSSSILPALASLYGRSLGPAFRIAMNATAEVAVLFVAATGRTLYSVSGHACLGADFCSCSAFKYLVVNKGEVEHCKHQLALHLLHRFHGFPLHRAIPVELRERIATVLEHRRAVVAGSSTSAASRAQEEDVAPGRLSRGDGSGSRELHAASFVGAADPAAESRRETPPLLSFVGPTTAASSSHQQHRGAPTQSNSAPVPPGATAASPTSAVVPPVPATNTGYTAVAAMAASPITFTDGDGLQWREITQQDYEAHLI